MNPSIALMGPQNFARRMAERGSHFPPALRDHKGELLYDCLFCGRRGYTEGSLRSHVCLSAKRGGKHKRCCPLTKPELQACIDSAKARAGK